MTVIAKPRILRSVSDEAGAAAESENSRQVSIKVWLTPEGQETKDIHEATGLRYTDIATGEKYELQVPGAVAGDPQTMLALFGASTLATNEASQIRQMVRRGEDPEGSEVDGITERFELLLSGTWREKREGGVGSAKIDRDLLAAVVVDVAAQNGKQADVATIRAKLDDDKKFFAAVRKDERMRKLYDERSGKESKPVDAVALI